MFADNERVSGLQVERQLLLVYLGPVTLWVVSGLRGREGMWSILLASGILCLWVFFLLRQVHVYRYPEKYWGKVMSRIILLGYQAYLILTGGWLVAKTGAILQEYLVEGISMELAAGILVLTALGGSHHVQARGRFAQSAWPVIGGLTGLMLFFGIFQGKQEFLTAAEGAGQIWNGDSFFQIAKGTGWILSAFLGVGFLPFLVVQADEKKGHAGLLFRTIGKNALWMGALLLILQAVFGRRGEEVSEYPVLDLMAGVRMPGGFVRRIDLIFLTVILFALLFTLGSVFFYSKYICQRIACPWSRTAAALLCFLLGISRFGQETLVKEYPVIMMWIFLPFFLALTVCTGFLRRRAYGK
ncbi:MAG: GerAB/ArcD/ProY family transporter [Clostridiales bacterium]|nr:GerAB/ArcD/ProY family transporter [Clostridiales bacterium]